MSLYPSNSVRVYSEKEHPFGPPHDQSYGVDEKGNPIQLPRDDRMWVSEEQLERWGYAPRS